MRQIVLDTETTGIDPQEGHRIIEIGCIELLNRKLTGNDFHRYLNPERDIDSGALEVHGITAAFLKDKPRFADIARPFLDYIDGAELIIHNAPFDLGFLDAELSRLGPKWGRIADRCTILDTLALARRLHPGQRNSLDALCRRYRVDHIQRDLHGALLDARILAQVYLAMTGGQASLSLQGGHRPSSAPRGRASRDASLRPRLKVIAPDAEEREKHERRLDAIEKASGRCLWREIISGPAPSDAQRRE